ncbi:hypothetical protein ABQX22_08085 [Xanthomonas sp. WHRI 1810A]|uniref:hypothetical protein n=1 Tax=Xanthomonas sp. WHRI 1810A TaxID=3161565 RepID=UPI0032E890B7
MTYKVYIFFIAGLVSLVGCAKDRSLSPPPDTEYITVTVKVPDELTAESMKMLYRSSICKFITYDSRGQKVELDGYKKMDMQPLRRGQSDLYEAKLPVDGGGACGWRLSNVTFGVVYGNPARFGINAVTGGGGGGGVVVIFDDHDSPRGGADVEVDGDLTVTKDYYPWVKENFLDGYSKIVSLAGEGYIYAMYKARTARQVYFEPIFHKNFALYSTGPKVKKEGSYRSYTYPDGSVYADGRSHPNFLRLQTIRLKAEGKQ